jgi:hypothetical protein
VLPHAARAAGELPGDPARRYPEALTEGDTRQARQAALTLGAPSSRVQQGFRSAFISPHVLLLLVPVPHDGAAAQVTRFSWRDARGGAAWRDGARRGAPALLRDAPFLGDTSSKARHTAANDATNDAGRLFTRADVACARTVRGGSPAGSAGGLVLGLPEPHPRR